MATPVETTQRQAPCIVLGLETQIGLGLVRELGRAGVPVIGIAHDARAIGLFSRYLWRKKVVTPARSEALLQVIRQLGEEHGPCCLLTVSEANLAWLNHHRHELGQVRPCVPSAESLATVLDKHQTLAAAQTVGIGVPATRQPLSMQEAQSLADDFPFPAVLKWADPNEVAGRLRAAGLALVKAEFVHTPAQWLDAARRYQPLGIWPMVQQYAPGRGLGQFFFMHDGQAVRRFQHVRVAEWPPEGGFSSVCDAMPLTQHQDLQERSVALLQAIGWQGVAMVEYRWDEASGNALLMEINGRFWGSFPLAVACGAGFARLCYQATMGLPLRPLPPPRQDLRCRMVATELKRLVRIGLQPGRIADRSFRPRPWAELRRFFADFVKPRVRYYVWAIDDPLPWLADLRNLLFKGVAG
jgi:predicted ATP-grasp superfamily ATP-dependent carboligase